MIAEYRVQIRTSDVEAVLRAATGSSRNDNPAETAVLLMAAADVVLRSFSEERASVEAQLQPHASALADKIEAALGEYSPSAWGMVN